MDEVDEVRVLRLRLRVLETENRTLREENRILASNAAMATACATPRTQLMHILQEVPAGIALVHGPEFRLRLANFAFQQVLHAVGEVCRLPFAQAFPQAAGPVALLLAQVRATGEPRQVVDLPLAFVEDDGHTEYRNVTLNLVPLGDETESADEREILLMAQDTTERVQTQARIREGEARLRTLIDSLPFDVWLRDAQGRLVIQNAASMALWGDAYGKHPEEMAPTDAMRQVWEEQNRRVLSGEVVRGEHQYQVGGETRTYYEIVAPVLVDDHIQGIIGANIDVTERRRTEEALRESTHFIERILEITPTVIYIYDIEEHRTIYANRQMMVQLGYSDEEITREGFIFSIFHPDDVPRIAALTAEISQMQEDRVVEIEYRMRDAQGRWRWYLSREAPFTRVPGKGVTQFLGSAQDITEQKNDADALARERAQLLSAIELLPFPIFFLSPTGMIFLANKASLTEIRSDDPNDYYNVAILLPETRVAVPMSEWPGMRSLRGETISGQERLLIYPDGREIPILVSAAPVLVQEQLVAAVVAFQDISSLKAADRAKDQFLMILSHELKTPLTSILGWAQAAQHLPDAVPQALEIIVRNAREQTQLLEDLLDITRMTVGKFTLKREHIELWSVAQSCADSLLPMVQAQGLTLVTEPPTEPLPLDADPKRLAQCLRNLLTNAVKFTEPGGAIWLRAYRRGNEAVLEVQDTGRGITPEQQPFLFKPFGQLQREEEKGGLGLGLSLVKGIIELHGGAVSVTSAGLGHGSTFSITLPLRHVPV